MNLYTLAFREQADPSDAYGPEERLEIATGLMATMGAAGAAALLVLPAGFVVAPSAPRRDEWAEALAAAARDAGVAIVFGVDVADREQWGVERCPRSFVYASDRGRRLLWCATPTARAAPLVQRTVDVGGVRVTVLFGRELFAARAASAVEVARPELVVVLGHGGPTKRWLPSLLALDELAPTLVVHQALGVRRPLQRSAPRGWRPTATGGKVSVVCYRREADGEGAGVARGGGP